MYITQLRLYAFLIFKLDICYCTCISRMGLACAFQTFPFIYDTQLLTPLKYAWCYLKITGTRICTCICRQVTPTRGTSSRTCTTIYVCSFCDKHKQNKLIRLEIGKGYTRLGLEPLGSDSIYSCIVPVKVMHNKCWPFVWFNRQLKNQTNHGISSWTMCHAILLWVTLS